MGDRPTTPNVALVLVLAITLAIPSLADVASTDPADDPRLLGGEVLLYQFDEDDLNTLHPGSVLDHSPFGAHATKDSSQGIVAGPNGFGSALDVADRTFNVDDTTSVDTLQDDFSLLTWINFQATSTSGRTILGAARADGGGFLSWQTGTSIQRVMISTTQGPVKTYELSVGTPHKSWGHLAIVAEGTTLTAYLDGAEAASTVIEPGLYQGSPVDVVRIGNQPFCCASSLPALIDEFRVYDRALSQDEVRSVRDAPYAVPNQAPIPDAGANQAPMCIDGGATVLLDGSGSSDPDGNTLSFAWSAPTATSITDTTVATTEATFALGTHTATLEVSDGLETATDTVEIQVVNGAGPTITSTWPAAPGVYTGSLGVPAPGDETVVVGSVDIEASAEDACTSVATVRFTTDDGVVHEDTDGAPYAFTYAPEGVGIQYRTVTVQAIDSEGLAGAPVTLELTVLTTSPRAP